MDGQDAHDGHLVEMFDRRLLLPLQTELLCGHLVDMFDSSAVHECSMYGTAIRKIESGSDHFIYLQSSSFFK